MKTACVYHSRDLDGWMSAAIVKHWWTKDQRDQQDFEIANGKLVGEIQDSIRFIGYDYGQPIPNLEEYDKIIMCDVSFSKQDMITCNAKDFVWIDHHSSAINEMSQVYRGLRDTKFAACELTWQYFFPNDTIPEIVRLLGRYDCFGHKGTDEELKVLEFQYGARQNISNYEEAYEYLTSNIKLGNSLCDELWYQGKTIYSYLCTEAKQIYKRAFPIEFKFKYEYYNDIPNTLGAIEVKKFLCVNQDRFNPINFRIDYHKEGYDGFACFWYANGKWNFSLYNDNEQVDCSVIAKQFGGGGHKGAAGFVTNDLKSVIGI